LLLLLLGDKMFSLLL